MGIQKDAALHRIEILRFLYQGFLTFTLVFKGIYKNLTRNFAVACFLFFKTLTIKPLHYQISTIHFVLRPDHNFFIGRWKFIFKIHRGNYWGRPKIWPAIDRLESKFRPEPLTSEKGT